jgi:hypothetical protein
MASLDKQLLFKRRPDISRRKFTWRNVNKCDVIRRDRRDRETVDCGEIEAVTIAFVGALSFCASRATVSPKLGIPNSIGPPKDAVAIAALLFLKE